MKINPEWESARYVLSFAYLQGAGVGAVLTDLRYNELPPENSTPEKFQQWLIDKRIPQYVQ